MNTVTSVGELSDALGLCRSPLRVLVVEDSIPFANRLTEFLREMGHDVTTVLGIESIEGDIATGPDLNEIDPCIVSIKSLHIAFLDHYFVSTKYDGTTLTRELKRRGRLEIVAMSSDVDANRRMMKEGATLSLRKSDLAKMLGKK